jgi:hypothetical protein
MNRLISILCLALIACAQCSCEATLGEAYWRQGGGNKTYRIEPPVSKKEAADNFQWFKARYYDADLTKSLNAASLTRAAKTLGNLTIPDKFEQPSLLPITYRGAEMYQLVEDWGFPLFGEWINVPKGIVVDGASVPRACWSFMPRDGRHRAGALAHDLSYQLIGVLSPDLTITRQQADDMLRDMMERAGVGTTTANIAYAAVRAFGGSSWGSHAPIILPVEHRAYAPRFATPRNAFSHIYATP